MIHFSKLGRYEYTNYSQNSDKFYSIKFIDKDEYQIMYGKNGYEPQKILKVDEKIANKRINEKIAKGYKHVDSNVDEFHKNSWIMNNKKNLELLLPEKDEKAVRKIKI